MLGIAGVAGNGQSELVAILTGMSAPSSGTVRIDGQAVHLGDPREFTRHKIARIPEDRLKNIDKSTPEVDGVLASIKEEYESPTFTDIRTANENNNWG